MNTFQPRVQAGHTGAGQFAPQHRTEPTVQLDLPATPPPAVEEPNRRVVRVAESDLNPAAAQRARARAAFFNGGQL